MQFNKNKSPINTTFVKLIFNAGGGKMTVTLNNKMQSNKKKNPKKLIQY